MIFPLLFTGECDTSLPPSLRLPPSLFPQLEGQIAELQAQTAAALQGQQEAQQQTADHHLQMETLTETQAAVQVATESSSSPLLTHLTPHTSHISHLTHLTHCTSHVALPLLIHAHLTHHNSHI